MKMQPGRLPKKILLLGIATVGLWSCTSSENPEDGSGGSTSKGGATSTGGGSGGSGSGGKTGSGGSVSSGGDKGSGGAVSSGGQTSSTGGSANGGSTGSGGSTTPVDAAAGGSQGSGGSANGGSTGVDGGPGGAGGRRDAGPGTGGNVGSGGSTGGGGSTGAGGSTSGECVKGQVKAKEVVIMGESFYAMAPQYIQKRVEENAKKAGAIGQSDSYRNVAVSGQPMNYIATTEWDNATKGGTVKFVIMDGGGIDCMSSSCPSCPDTFRTLLGKMATAGVENVIYTRYPEPGNPPGSNATLKGNLDTLMPKMEEVCKSVTSPKCHWVDLRPVWKNGDTSDGLHPTQSGGEHCGDAIWAKMVEKCLAQ